MSQDGIKIVKNESSSYGILNFSRVLSIVSLPLSIIQSLIFVIYLLNLPKDQNYSYHGISIEGCVHACLIYGVFYKKPKFLLPYVGLQIGAGLLYIFVALHFCIQIIETCGSLFHCPSVFNTEVNEKVEFMFLASLSIPFQCAIAAIILKCYKELVRREKQNLPFNI